MSIDDPLRDHLRSCNGQTLQMPFVEIERVLDDLSRQRPVVIWYGGPTRTSKLRLM